MSSSFDPIHAVPFSPGSDTMLTLAQTDGHPYDQLTTFHLNWYWESASL